MHLDWLQVVLTVIENQVLVWLGVGMSPLLPALGAAANILHFYKQKLLAMYVFVPPKKAYWAFAWWGTGLYWWAGLVYLRQWRQVRREVPVR